MQPNEKSQQEWQKRVTSLLDDGEQGLDGKTLHELARARQNALQKTAPKRTWVWPTAGFATACIAIVLTINLWRHDPAVAPVETPLEDFELLTQNDDIEFYNDLEMMEWLDDDENAS